MHEQRDLQSRSGAAAFRHPTIVAAAVYAAAVVLFTWPLVLNLTTVIATTDTSGDPALHLWTLGWDLQAISSHPQSLVNGRVFNANIFFPASQTLAYSDHLLPQAIALWPLFAATGDLVLAYNVLLLGSLVACALAMHLLARSLLHSEPAAYVAGLVFGFAPYHFTHLIHIQLQALYFLPLSFLFLHRLFAARRWTDTAALGIVLGLQALSSPYYGTIGALGVGVAVVVLSVLDRRLGDWRLACRLLTALGLAVLVALPWSIPYLRVARDTASSRTLAEAARGSAVPASYLQAPETNLLYGQTGWLRPGGGSRLPRKEGPEQNLFLGFSVCLLAACGVASARRVGYPVVGVYLAVGLGGAVLSMGPDGARTIYTWLYQLLPPMEAIRAPARFSVLTLCAAAILAAAGVRAWELRVPRAASATLAVALAAIGLEYANGSIPFAPRPALASEAGRWLASQPGTGAVICLPMDFGTGNTPCMLQSLEHRRPVVNGYSGIRPPFFSAVVEAMAQMPSSEALRTLHELGVEYVVSDRPLATPDVFGSILVERATFTTQQVYQIMWSPDAVARLTVDHPAPPAEPGAIPFAVGESSTYRVRWTSGPIDATAGEASLTVAPSRGVEVYRFVVSAQAADWVSRIFDVDAQLETSADARLLPLRHVSTITQGRRRTHREAVFDASSGRAQWTTSAGVVDLPLSTDARDPIAALFYLRTIPFTPGSSLSIPLTSNGVAMRLELGIGSPERITAEGRSWDAWRVDARISRAIERRRSPAITAWIGADARRIPIRFDVAADFGTIRLDLAEYRAP